MGNGMNKVLPGLYVGNYRDSKDPQQLDRYNITHILAIHDSPRRLLPDKHYLCVMAADTPDQNLSQYFPVCNDFIHAARLRDGNVLIHCLAGMSRSVTVAVAYIMSVTPLTWKEALKVVRAGRSVANPNLGFQTQLNDYETYKILEERKRLKERFPSQSLRMSDREQCGISLNCYEELLSNKDICEGNCSRGQDCPTGMCRSESTKGIFRRKASSSSIKSRLSAGTTSQSCPTSPRYGNRSQRGGNSRLEPSTSASARRDSEVSARCNVAGQMTRPCDSRAIGGGGGGGNVGNVGTSEGYKSPGTLHRSTSSVSNYRAGNSPSGLYSYTGNNPGSAPTSVHGSRVELSGNNTGSAIYLGFTPPGRSTYIGSNSTWSVSKISSSGSGPPTPINTPPVSPKHLPKRSSWKK